MKRGPLRFLLIGGVIAAIISGWLALRPSDQAPSPPASESGMTLGFSYIMLTPQLAEYYRLGVISGALVTDIAPGGEAEKAGVRRGDVILAFNGDTVESARPLLGMIRACRAGSQVVMELWRDNVIEVKELVHLGE